jgi:hypothetical protein
MAALHQRDEIPAVDAASLDAQARERVGEASQRPDACVGSPSGLR